MAGHLTDQFSYVTGAVRAARFLYLGRVADELAKKKVDHSYFTLWNDGKWGGGDVDTFKWSTVGIAVVKQPLLQGVFLGLWGEVFCVGSGQSNYEKIDPKEENRMPFRGIRSIDGKAYAVGMGRQVYRRDGKEDWTRIDQGARQEAEQPGVTSFETIDGFSKTEIYAAGRGGELWTFNGKAWKRLDSPTNMILTNICCAGDGNVYACGRVGTLLQGRKSAWKVIKHGTTQDDLWGLAWYRDRLYVSSMKALYVLEDGALRPVEFEDDVPGSFYHLSAAEGVLCSIGPKDVMLYDGKEWSRVD